MLVFHDLLGITTGHMAKFVKRYAEIHDSMVAAVGAYGEEVRAAKFPAPEHSYSIDETELARFRDYIEQESLTSAKAWEWEPLS